MIGEEILSGHTKDTNSSFIASELKAIGISVHRILTVKDELSEILWAFSKAFESSDLVFTTGGLGPTKDDKTLLAYADYFETQLFIDPETLAHLTRRLEKANRAYLLDLNKSQATVLKGARVFQNDHGTAPCQWIEKNNKYAVCLPGVPYEVKPLVREKLIPYLVSRFSFPFMESRTVTLTGIPESELSNLIEPWELSLPSEVSLSYLPVGNRIKLHLATSAPTRALSSSRLDLAIETLRPYVSAYVLAWNTSEIEVLVKDLLEKRNLSLSVVESCTGGEISRLLVTVPGISKNFKGALVAYDTEMKIKVLGVKEETISTHGVASLEVASEMSDRCLALFQSDAAISTTGVAGPSSDAFASPLGEVFISVRVGDKEQTRHLNLPHFDRTDFMNFVSQRALQALAEMLVKGE